MTPKPRGVAVTAREREVLSLVSRHLTNAEIARQLCLSVRTVEAHVSALIRKLRASDRRALARHAERDSEVRDRIRWPAPVTSFVGRDVERAALTQALRAHRMVTVTGPGGVGKTRLALDVAQQFANSRRDSGWFIDLVEVTDAAMVITELAAALGVGDLHGGSLAGAVVTALAASDAVIVLDNCEHLLDAVRSCAELLVARCPSLVVVATSRTRLVAPFEAVFEVPGLSVIDNGGDAVALFIDRVAGVGGPEITDRQGVVTLCRALDGMPLAIELAAARYPSLGLDGLVGAIDQQLRVLTSSSRVAGRHSSLRNAIAWSYGLLDEDSRRVLSHLSVFASWFVVDGARAVARPASPRVEVAQCLARLAEQSLLVAAPGAPTRYRALETIRQYGDEILDASGECDEVHVRHRHWCRDQLELLAAEPSDEGVRERLDSVAADARAAIMWAAEHGHDDAVADLAEQLALPLLLRGQPTEAQLRYEQAARHAPAGSGSARARLLWLAAGAAASRLVGDDTLRLLRHCAAEALATGDRATAAEALAWTVIYTRQYPGIIATVPTPQETEQALAEARTLAAGAPGAEATVEAAITSGIDESRADHVTLASRAADVARRAGQPLIESVALDQLCALHLGRGELRKAIDVIHQRGDVVCALPLDASTAFQYNDYLLMASEVHLAVGDLVAAGRYADILTELACYRDQNYPALARRIKVDALAGDLDVAAARGDIFITAWERAGRPLARTLTPTTCALAMVHGLLGDQDRRRLLLDEAAALLGDADRLRSCETGYAPTMDALVALHLNQPDVAIDRLSADIDDTDIWPSWIAAMWRPWYAALWAEAAVLADHPDAQARLQRSATATTENPIAAIIVQRAVDLAAGNRGAFRRHAESFATLGCRYQQGRTHALLATMSGT